LTHLDVVPERKQLSEASQDAYRRGDGAAAKELSIQAKKKLALADAANAKAAEAIFTSNNNHKGSSDRQVKSGDRGREYSSQLPGAGVTLCWVQLHCMTLKP
jgi:hypothetical protein